MLYTGQSDVFVLPSIHEPFGIVLLEAWLMGLTVFANPIGGVKDLFETCKGHILDINNPAELATQILEFENSRMFREQEENRKTVVSQFSWKKIAMDHLKIYKEL